jgi:hypothetical protein
MPEPQEARDLTKDEVSDMITEALKGDRYARKPEGLEGELAELDEIMKQIELYTPLIESYGPKLIAKTGPALRSIMAASFKELMPVLLPVIRREAQVVAKEFVTEYFRQLDGYTKRTLEGMPEMMKTMMKNMEV